MTWFGKGAKATRHSTLNVGDVVKARIVTDDGKDKPRRSVVLAMHLPATDDPLRCVLVVGVTTDNHKFDPANSVRYPPLLYHPMPYAAGGGHPTTFDEPCAAAAVMVQRFRRDELPSPVGTLNQSAVQELGAWVNRYLISLRADRPAGT